MADSAAFQHKEKTSAHRNSSAEQSHGTVVSHALSHARSLSQSRRVRLLVQQPNEPDGRGGTKCECETRASSPRSASSVHSPSTEERGGEGGILWMTE